MLYTGTLMTENVFYPLFLVVALALVAMLERPTAVRQIGLLALCLVAFLARQQAVALVAAAATAPVLLALIDRQAPRRFLRTYAPLYGIFAAGAVVALLDTVARGRSVYSLLGAYRAATTETYTVSGVGHYLLWHVAEFDLYVGVIPFAALVAIWLAPRDGSPRVRAFAAGSFAIAAWLVLEVAAFASQQSERIEERNMFYLAPLAFVALLGLAGKGVVPTRRRALIPAAALAAVLPVFIPFPRFITTSAVSDTFALLPWWWIQDHWVHLGHLKWAAFAAAIGGAALFLLLPRRFALVLPALVGAYFVATSFVVENGRHGIHLASVGSLWAGIHVKNPDWIDRAVGSGASVDYVWSGTAREYSIWENEFFNRSLRNVMNLAGPSADPLPQISVSRRGDGVLLAGGKPVRCAVRPGGRLERGGRAHGRRRPWHRVEALPRRRAGRPAHARDRPLPERHVVGKDRHLPAREMQAGASLGAARQRPVALLADADGRCTRRRRGRRASERHPDRPGDADRSAATGEAGRILHRSIHGHPYDRPQARHQGQHRRPSPRRALPRLHLQTVRIAFDVSPLSHERTGVNNYIRGSLQGIAEVAREEGHEVVAFAPTSSQGRRTIPEALAGFPVELRLKTFLGAHGVRTAWSRIGWPPAEKWLGPFDVLHFSDWMYPPQRRGLRATMIHDLVPIHFPDWVTPRTRSMHGHKYRNAARTCDVIFTNSAFTADDIAATLGFPRERIVVAHPGIGAEFTPEGQVADVGQPYALTVATLEPRKNLGTLVDAWQLLADTGVVLAVVGGEGWGEQPKLDRPGVLRLGRVDDDELARLYRGAAVVVYPSRFEGFGMPITEAMASGAPVVASSHASLDEACGPAALRADPESAEDFAAAVREALKRRDELRWKGFAHAAGFSWRRNGELHIEGYRRFS